MARMKLVQVATRLATKLFGGADAVAGRTSEIASTLESTAKTHIGSDAEGGQEVAKARARVHDVPARTSEPSSTHRAAVMRPHPSLDAELRKHLGEPIAKQSIVTGPRALEETFGPGFEHSPELEVSVPDTAALDHLVRQPGWTRMKSRDGRDLVTDGRIRVSVGANGVSHEDLVSRGWRAGDGPLIASVPDTCSLMQRKGSVEDLKNIDEVRRRLHNPENGPLPEHVTHREHQDIRTRLPREALDHPYAHSMIKIASHHVYAVRSLMGHPDILAHDGLPLLRHYWGPTEAMENGLRATYHNGHGLINDLERGRHNLDALRAQGLEVRAQDYLSVATSGCAADGRYGGNRAGHSVTAADYDERRSGELVRAHAIQEGLPRDVADGMRKQVLGTKFTESTATRPGMQAGRFDPDWRVQTLAGEDLDGLGRGHGPLDGTRLFLEDSNSTRVVYKDTNFPNGVVRPGRVLIEHGVACDSVADMWRGLDELGHIKPVIDGVRCAKSLREFGGDHFSRNAGFTHPNGYQAPPLYLAAHTELAVQVRTENAAILRKWAGEVYRGKSFLENDAEALSYAQQVGEKYGPDML
ncbi:hypothetical protein ACFYO1_01945 [Nocardia sp. NPDC006044]|uniref:hypothetical protein n=1 Tax=Nocardia sp. NPDC006044 TaxID=3364306 RepID=UPI0036A3BC4B